MVYEILYHHAHSAEQCWNLNLVSFVSERYFSTVVHTTEGMNANMAGPSANGSHTPPLRPDASPVTNKSQNA